MFRVLTCQSQKKCRNFNFPWRVRIIKLNTMENNAALPDHGRHEDGISLTTGNVIMGSKQDDSSCHMVKMNEDKINDLQGYQNLLEVPAPVATPTPTSNANTRTDIRSQIKTRIPQLPMTATPPQTPLTNVTTEIGSWKVSTPPSIEALRAMYQSSRRPGPYNITPMQGITPMCHPSTCPPLPLLCTEMQSADTMITNQHLCDSIGTGSRVASSNSTLLQEDWASLFRNISTSDSATQENIKQAYAALTRTSMTNPVGEASWQFQKPIHLQSVIKEQESKGVIGDIGRHNEDNATEPPTKKSKKLVGTCTVSEKKGYNLISSDDISSNNNERTMSKTDENTEQEDNEFAAMIDREIQGKVGPQNHTQQHVIPQLVRSEREQHMISRKIQRLLLIRHCSICTIPIPPPPHPPLAFPCPPLSFLPDICGTCIDSDTTKVPPPSGGVFAQQHLPTNQVAVCPVTSHCAEGKALCAHILSCKLKKCMYRGCLTTREVLGHHMRCRIKECEVCSPVRVLDQKRRRSVERREENAKKRETK